jgi:hypothetical protein
MAGDSKFVQISAAEVQIQDQIYEELFALDNDGDVWQYRFPRARGGRDKPMWIPLSRERKKS